MKLPCIMNAMRRGVILTAQKVYNVITLAETAFSENWDIAGESNCLGFESEKYILFAGHVCVYIITGSIFQSNLLVFHIRFTSCIL